MSSYITSSCHLVSKNDWRNQKFVDSQCTLSTALKPGEILVQLSSFNLTANNVTYAAIGELLGYWGFFPSDDPSQGRVPVWGLADIVKSESTGIEAGDRLYGYFPMTTYMNLKASISTEDPRIVVETSEHRRSFWPLYQRYRIMPAQKKDTDEEALDSILYIPYLTAYSVSRSYSLTTGEKKAIIILSASSKCAYCLASILSTSGACTVFGTSSTVQTKDFAESLGFYDKVYTYEELASDKGKIDLEKRLSGYRTSIIDFSGRGQAVEDLQRSIEADRLERIVLVGGTDSGAAQWNVHSSLTEQFFLPGDDFLENQIKEDGGLKSFNEKFGESGIYHQFVTEMMKCGRFTIVRKQGKSAIQQKWNSLLAAERDPTQEIMFSF